MHRCNLFFMKENVAYMWVCKFGVLWYLRGPHMLFQTGTWCHQVIIFQDLSVQSLTAAGVLCTQSSVLVKFLIYFSTVLFCNTFEIIHKMYLKERWLVTVCLLSPSLFSLCLLYVNFFSTDIIKLSSSRAASCTEFGDLKSSIPGE
jgi:hypothetical protein